MKKAGLALALVTLLVAGCGVDWFPKYERLATTPDDFSFGTKTAVAFNTSVTSDSITVAGLATADTTSPISVSGATGSTYSINGATAVSSTGTVKNGDKVTVTHTSATTPATSVTSRLSIGAGSQVKSADFVSVTRNVESFALTATGASGALVNSGQHLLVVANGTYTVTVSGNGGISFTGQGGTYLTNTTTTVALTNQMPIFMTSTVPSTVTVTIDGVASTFTTTVQ